MYRPNLIPGPNLILGPSLILGPRVGPGPESGPGGTRAGTQADMPRLAMTIFHRNPSYRRQESLKYIHPERGQ